MSDSLATGQNDNNGPSGSRKPRIGDSRPAPESSQSNESPSDSSVSSDAQPSDGDSAKSAGRKRRRRGGRGRGGNRGGGAQSDANRRDQTNSSADDSGGGQPRRKKRGGRQKKSHAPVEAMTSDGLAVELSDDQIAARKGRERQGKPIGRYTMAVSVRPEATQIAILEGRKLIEHYVSLPADEVSQIHGNIYLGRVQNVLPGMEAAFVDISTPKNAVLYRGDVQYDKKDFDGGGQPRIEEVLKNRQSIVCQVTKNPIAHKGARLTQEVSIPGRFVVLVPHSTTYGISKRLPDSERKRLRKILDRVRPKGHGIIVRTAAENVTAAEIEADVSRLADQWNRIDELAKKTAAPAVLYREPDMALRVIREEFSKDYRAVVIDDPDLYDEVSGYVSAITPALADRVQYYDRDKERLSLFERENVYDQLVKALDRKVWLPSGGSLIIEQTEALTVIDVNTGKNVGKTSLEQTVYKNNVEAAREVARQLRLRDIGGIIVIDFVDMEVKKHRDEVVKVFKDALARDKTRTQVYDISDLGLVEMTRKRVGEGLIESVSNLCLNCDGRGLEIDERLVEKV